MPSLDSRELAEIVGPVAAREFDNAKEIYKADLNSWAQKLADLTDGQFLGECSSAIYNSALVSQFRGNWEHEHFKASACFHEAQRRHVAAGHSAECHGNTLYSEAHAKVMRESGYQPTPAADCNCTKSSRRR
ncbi:hypothetical protein ACFY4C_21065 [Actinomadura viridis]|uniref:hypothetical protein n=1 Tax=Actinomadura viridis TaxID=58110 RepID=UPI0036768636